MFNYNFLIHLNYYQIPGVSLSSLVISNKITADKMEKYQFRKFSTVRDGNEMMFVDWFPSIDLNCVHKTKNWNEFTNSITDSRADKIESKSLICERTRRTGT